MSGAEVFRFRLYTADDTLNSRQALANLRALCATYVPDRHEIEVIDLFREPERALRERIFITPTLIKLAPGPIEKLFGTLSETALVLQVLGLDQVPK